MKKSILLALAPLALGGFIWGGVAHAQAAHAHESLNDCYQTSAGDGSDALPHIVGRHTLTHLGDGLWLACVHHVSAD